MSLQNQLDKNEIVPIASLVSDPANARKHSPKNLEAIKGSLAQFGQQKPLVVAENNVVIAGNGTLWAMRDLGMKEVWISRSGLEGAKATGYAIADNRTGELAEWDDDVLSKTLEALKNDIDLGSIGFDDADLANLIKAPEVIPGCDEDEVPEVVEPRTKPGDLYQLGNHRLLCGDSTNVQHVERLMGGEKADLWVTDPPYGVDIKQVSIDRYQKTGRGNTQSAHNEIANDIASKDGWREVLLACFANAYIATTDKASHYVFTCQGSDKQMMMMMMMMQESGWNFRHEILWIKNRFILGRSDYHYQHEPCLYGWKEKGTHEWFGGRDKSSILQFDVSKNDLHPTMKPIGLLEQLISNSSRIGGKVIDTFLGSGSTLIACEKTNRKCFGMEIDPHYCDVVVARWEKFTGKTAILQTGA